MKLDQALVDAAKDLLKRRFPGKEGIAAAMYTEDGEVLASVFFEPEWGGGLCAETGAMLEAEKLGRRVTASVCVSRLNGDSPIVVLTPSASVRSACFTEVTRSKTPDPDKAGGWLAKTLQEVQPYHWVKAFKKDT